MLKYCHNRCKTQEIRNKADHAHLPTVKSVPDWFVTNKMLEKLNNVVFPDDDLDLDDVDSDTVTFFSDGMGFVTIGIIDINLHDNNIDKDDPAKK